MRPARRAGGDAASWWGLWVGPLYGHWGLCVSVQGWQTEMVAQVWLTPPLTPWSSSAGSAISRRRVSRCSLIFATLFFFMTSPFWWSHGESVSRRAREVQPRGGGFA